MKIFSRFLSSSLRFKILSGLLLALIPMLIIVGITYYTARNSTMANSERIMKLIIRNGAKEANGFIKAQAGVFSDWTAEDVFGMAIEFETTKELKSHFKSFLKGQKGFSLIMLTDKNGKVLQAAAGEHTKGETGEAFIDRSVKAVYELSHSGARGVTFLESDFMTQLGQRSEATFLFSFKTKDSEGKPNGFFLAYVDWSNLQARVSAVLNEMKNNGFENAQVAIVNLASNRAHGHSNEEMIGNRLEMPDALQAWIKGNRGGDVRQFDMGEEIDYVTFTPIQTTGGLIEGDTSVQSESGLVFAGFVPENDIMYEVKKILWTSAGIGGGGAVVIVLIGLFIVQLITKPLKLVNDGLKDIAEGEGDLTTRLNVTNEDEVGQLAKSFNTFMEKLQGIIKDIAKNSDTLNVSSGDLSKLSGQMSEGADNMSGKSNTVATAAEEMSSNMSSVAVAMEQASTNVSMVAKAIEEITSTVNEIAQNTEKASTVTSEAVSQAKSASERVVELGKAAQDIGKVTEAITEISEQTNLLALNATIEAARAGEAGKGFAVVANEIKELAKQTAEATQEIREKIQGTQDSTAGTVTEIEQISKVINEVNEIVSTIAAAIEEQTATTKEVADNVGQAAKGIQDVNENVNQSSTVAGEIARDVSEVNQSAGEMSSSSSQVKLNAEELRKLAEQLEGMVSRFKLE